MDVTDPYLQNPSQPRNDFPQPRSDFTNSHNGGVANEPFYREESRSGHSKKGRQPPKKAMYPTTHMGYQPADHNTSLRVPPNIRGAPSKQVHPAPNSFLGSPGYNPPPSHTQPSHAPPPHAQHANHPPNFDVLQRKTGRGRSTRQAW